MSPFESYSDWASVLSVSALGFCLVAESVTGLV